MAGITTFLDPAQMPGRAQDQQTFDNLMAAFMQLLPKFAGEINATLAALNALAAGGVYAMPFKFSTATTDGDPGAGFLRLDSATQSAATTIRLDLVGMDTVDYTGLIDTFDASTSTIKGQIRVTKQTDSSKFIDFNVTARAAPTGYRNITVTPIAASSANPFANNDPVMLFFQRTGDKGDIGNGPYQLLASATVSAAVANIDFLNIFTSAYDKYVIELEGLTRASVGSVFFQLAKAGAVDTTPQCYSQQGGNGQSLGPSATNFMTLGPDGTQMTQTVDVRNANSTLPKGVSSRGYVQNGASYSNALVEGVYAGATAVTGFRLAAQGGSNFTAGTIRVYGIKNT